MDFWKIKRALRKYLGGIRLYHCMRFIANKKNIPFILSKYGQTNSDHIVSLMKEAWVKYYWNFDEFFLYDYASLNELERSSFVPEYEKNIFCDKANDNIDDLIFHDKWSTYMTFQKYYKRDACLLKTVEDLKSSPFLNFIEKHKAFILKPVHAATGRGIDVFKCDNCSDAISKLSPILSGDPFILEELIVQSDDLASFHPSSVNTVRISTFRYGNSDTEILYPFIKFGTGGNFVDNGGRGGIICKIDLSTGEIVAAVDESPAYYSHHPNTGKKIVGYKIPYWDDALALAKELAEVLPNVRYVGWDLALTDEGWVMVEGNEKGMFIGFQLPTHQGFRHHFNQICQKAKIKLK